ncbi:McrB family protein [Vibrio cholerae]|uniref:McrB family protein n=1 Tax=Vibrio cholerae TaxID=666 RepID=UPI001F55A5C2|nr:restriction endonuclease [Vibrio cholerae]
MQIEEALSKSRMWIDQLVGKELQYITGRNTSVINNVDWDDEGKIFVSRGEGQITIRFERIAAVISKLINGHPVHVDTILRSGSNDRSVIETIIANFPPVGFMLPNKGRNKRKNKVLQWLNKEIHSLGNIMDISADEFAELSLSISEIKNAQFLSKPFLLLAGISGTGKTRFVREQAKTSQQFADTYCLTSVRPDWHEPSDLLGYISRLNGAAEYITTDVLQFIAKAWRAIADSGLAVQVQESEEQGERLVIAGERDELDKVLPYWLCLDEMNLAPVEQYFADYLSVLETREWRWTDDSFTYSCDALLKPATIKEVADKEKLREALGFEGSQYDELWADICQYGLGIPFNLLVAGTVNMDETTHGFSRKVIDRALSFDFGAFFPNDYNDFFTPTSCNKRLSYPIWSNASKADLDNTFDADGTKTVAFLSAVNAVLKNTPFELAFRALNELLLAVASSQPQDDLTLKAVWDDFMMCKVLPRIEGDTDKLTTSDGKALLVELNTVLAAQLAPIWLVSDTDEGSQRPDLYREKIVADGATEDEKVLRIPCRSKAKLQWMGERLASATFTSFWP